MLNFDIDIVAIEVVRLEICLVLVVLGPSSKVSNFSAFFTKIGIQLCSHSLNKTTKYFCSETSKYN